MEPQKTVIEQLADYIKKNLIKGYSSDTLRFSLMSQGYSRISVDKALEKANQEIAETIPPIKEKPQISYKVVLDRDQLIEDSGKTKKPFWKRIFGE